MTTRRPGPGAVVALVAGVVALCGPLLALAAGLCAALASALLTRPRAAGRATGDPGTEGPGRRGDVWLGVLARRREVSG